jgi:enoyl-CoA hydratase
VGNAPRAHPLSTVPDAVQTSAADGVLVITLNRPAVRNAIDSALSLGVHAALGALDTDDSLRVGVLTGAGGTFCAGMDLKAFAVHGLPDKIDDVLHHGCRKPLIAAIESIAVGGGLELALIADLLVAARDARIGSPEVKFGLFPGGGALLRLPRHLPQSLVTELALTGELMSAEAAYAHGLIVRLSEPGRTLDTALELARSIARNAPLGVDAALQLLRSTPGRTEEELWAEQVALVDAVFNSDDAQEGARAFAEKRPPEWSGR